MILSLCLCLLSIGTVYGERCDLKGRDKIYFYYDERSRTCFAYPIECDASLQVFQILYETEEECTLSNMGRRWKTYKLKCPGAQRMAVYSRQNGDLVPYIFDSRLCSSGSRSDICNSDETCYTTDNFGWCCSNIAFEGDGAETGRFNYTGIGGEGIHTYEKASTDMPLIAPVDCNEDGMRSGVEWYPERKLGMGCISRRSFCSSPAYPRPSLSKLYTNLQTCLDKNFPAQSFVFKFSCPDGFTPASDGKVPLVFHKQLCGSPHHSDFCNRDEFCAFNEKSNFAFCCAHTKLDNKSVHYEATGRPKEGRLIRRRKYRSINVTV